MRKLIYWALMGLLGYTHPEPDLKINLEHQEGFGMFMQGSIITFPSKYPLAYQNVPEDIDEYVVRNMILQSAQYHWNRYLDKKIDKEEFEKIRTKSKIDTTQLTTSPVDCELLVLIGTRGNKQVIIVDSNNDEDFGNDEVLEYEFPLTIQEQKAIRDQLPEVSVQYEYYENHQIITREIKIKPSPYKGNFNATFNSENPIEHNYYLHLSFPGYKKGRMVSNGLDYEIFVSNGFAGTIYTAVRTSIFIVSPSDSLPSQLKGDIPYNVGDIFNLAGHDYRIDSITRWGDELFIKYMGHNTMPTGITPGYYMPKFEAAHLDNSIFELSQHPGKYILLDFWGTWCNPCIKLIPELQKINADYPSDKFTLVSVAYDRDPEKVANFIKEKNMDWVHLFVNQMDQSEKTLVRKLKVYSYPTTILIDPDGKIIARDLEIEKLRELLDEKITAR